MPTLIGGLVGIVAGVTVTATAAAVAVKPLAVPPLSLWASVSAALAIGAIAGLYPALRATRLTPPPYATVKASPRPPVVGRR